MHFKRLSPSESQGIISMRVDSDVFSKLQDDLLRIIISELPLKDAVRSSVLSKRWRNLYREITKLTLAPDLVMASVNPDPLSIARVEDIISNLLTHSSDLEAFDLSTFSEHVLWRFTCQSIWKWVQIAASRNVRHLALRHLPPRHFPQKGILPPPLFSCNTLARLELFNYIVSDIPPNLGIFNRLITCEFLDVEFRDDCLDRLISHCPLLENLCILNYFGPQKIIISASNIATLCVSVYGRPAELYVNCPKLRSLELLSTKYFYIQNLTVNGLFFQELSSTVWCLELQCGSNLIELSLNSSTGKALYLTEERFAEILGTFKFLKELYIYNSRSLESGKQICNWRCRESKKEMDIPIPNLLQLLPHLERLDLNHMFILNFTRDPNLTCAFSPLLNVRMVTVSLHNLYDKEMTLLSWLLETALKLETMEVQIPQRKAGEEEKYRHILAKMADLKSAASRAEVRVVEGERTAVFGI